MRSLFVLRPVQIIDVAFQLMREKFVRSGAIAFAVIIPLQSLVWIVEASIGDLSDDSGLVARTVFIAIVLQFFAIGVSLCLIANLLSPSVGKTYSFKMFGYASIYKNAYTRLTVAIWQVFIQVVFLLCTLGTRYLLAKAMGETEANVLAYFTFFALMFPWVFATLRSGFMIPASVHEDLDFSKVRKRTRALNKKSYWTLFGVHSLCVLLIVILIMPSLFITETLISNNAIKSDLGALAMTNVVIAFVVAAISIVYAYVLTVTYFNSRIKYEGFDIALSLQELEQERSSRGDLLRSVS